jgi:hypothetical protein
MRSRFAERAYYKPKGYAGDFRMMEMIYANRPQGDGRLGGLVDQWCLNISAARAVRGRRSLLKKLLLQEAALLASRPGPMRILNLACGSCRELFDFLGEKTDPAPVEAICLDHLLQWKLIHRDPEKLRILLADTPFGAEVEVYTETEGVNLFLIARKTTVTL